MQALNDGQAIAVKHLLNWNQSTQRLISLQGAAGTGKTFLLGHVLPKITKKPLITAPTNEAVTQSQNAVKMQNATFMTTFAALGYGFKIENERKSLKKLSNPKLDFDLIVIDEASMLDSELISELKKTKIKLLFVYHASQLPPVSSENLSLSDKCYSPIVKENIPTLNLTQQMRNTNEIFTFCSSIEENIYNEEYLKLSTYSEFFKSLESSIKTWDKDSFFSGESVFISWTNAETDKYNSFIRDRIFGSDESSSLYLPGDRILLTEPCTYFGELSPRITSKVIKSLEPKAITFSTNTKFIVKKVFQISIFNIDCYGLDITHQGLDFTLYVPKDLNHFESIKLSMIEEGRKKFKAARDNHFKWFHLFDSIFAKVKHSYAITTHRSQGSTIPKVFVNWKNINQVPNPYLRKKMLYVASSRAKESLQCLL